MAATVTRDQHRAIDRLAAGDWQAAHAIVQNLEDPLSCSIHALCHRIEGDPENARYWYRRAGVAFTRDRPVEQEIAALQGEIAESGIRRSR